MSSITVACAYLASIIAYLPGFYKNAEMRRLAKDVPGVNVDAEPREAIAAIAKAGGDEDAVHRMMRANAAHYNSLEGLPWFYGSLLFAVIYGVPTKSIDAVALTYLIARALYVMMCVGARRAGRGYGNASCSLRQGRPQAARLHWDPSSHSHHASSLATPPLPRQAATLRARTPPPAACARCAGRRAWCRARTCGLTPSRWRLRPGTKRAATAPAELIRAYISTTAPT